MKAINKAKDIVQLALHSLAVHKVRSALTMLGIIFGVWSVIVMLAINEGASRRSQAALREMGSDNIIIDSIKPPADQGSASSGLGFQALVFGLTRRDVNIIKSNIPKIQMCVVAHKTQKHLYAMGKKFEADVLGTEPSYGRIVQMRLDAGRFITSADMIRRKAHCVILRSLSDRLFGYRDPLGRIIRLNNEPFTVVGVLERLPTTLSKNLSENTVIVPLSADRERFGDMTVMRSAGTFMIEKVEVSQIILKMADRRAVMNAASILRHLLPRYHDNDDYDIKVPMELITQQQEQSRLWNIAFFVIASVSLVVGGIGIMNIMLAGVTERTREIGIRRALGAKKRDIVIQFLVESVTLTMAGGIIGVAAGLAGPRIVEPLLKLQAVISPGMLALPFVMAIIVGVVSGLYPALRAAALDPIEALRHE